MKKGHAYYYLVESARVNGKPRIVRQRYLGTAESVAAAFDSDARRNPVPEFSKVMDFGAVTALYDIAEKIGLRRIIDRHAGKRAQGLSVSNSIILAAINRAVLPTSKKSFYDWFEKTTLSKLFPNANRKSLSSQGFWNNMKQLNQNRIRAIEDEIMRTIIQKYDIETDCLLLDNTNFFTYIDTENPAMLPQRGKSKEKRSDLKIVGLSLLVSPDHSIPLFHEAYPGNTNDAKQFGKIVTHLKERFAGLGKAPCRITLVFDKGNNSEDNIAEVLGDKERGFDFVGALRFNQCPEFNRVSLDQFTPLESDKLKDTIAYRSKKHVYNMDLTVVLTFNPALYDAQLSGVITNAEKCAEKLKMLEKHLCERSEQKLPKGRAPTIGSIQKKIAGILTAEYMKELFICKIWHREDGKIQICSKFADEVLEKLKAEKLGRSILLTNHHDWTTERIVSTYRSQYHVEESFRQMKDRKYLSFRPIHHFTDANIRVHAFYCVLSLLLAGLLNKELDKMGHKVSIHSMLDYFQHVQQVITYFPAERGKKRRCISSFSGLDGYVKEYIEKYELTKLATNF
jgi:transposase